MSGAQLPVYSVSQVNGYLKELVDGDPLLRGLLVRGEVSNYKCYPSGHHYFSLKDEQGSIRCVMFRGDAARLRFKPVNGLSVIAYGRVSVYPRDGQYQLYCTQLMEDGRGALDRAFEELKKKLEAQGLFDPAKKQSLPAYPRRIALVTSPAGAAVRDMIRILRQRWPLTEVLVVPVRVQGEGAAEEIAAAIHQVNNRDDIDLIITGRGGGSREDLWAFNEEPVAWAIALSNIPVISAVGHEPDVTISDYVADLRASTPSNAAELAVPDQQQERQRLEGLTLRLRQAMEVQLDRDRKELRRLEQSRVLRNPVAVVDDQRMRLDGVQRRLAMALERTLRRGRVELAGLAGRVDAMSPLKVLSRGYAIAKAEGRAVTTVEQVQPGQAMDVLVADGVYHCRVEEKEEQQWR
ncbi:exodeoxyribonuclease VII large subunit [Pseudoflavonifractor sp. An176]|uniref:exodeoxyribonuclease VII large subunit n=1 Tax=Pseudoflavonifractor sp. An176 TaxID=1965572 RepID=UPI000B3790AE|nr:exodeoxyribonuclease VII large subunit [Pseudoflavonifractor sp. An176]OUP65631.1 exodeoxyribonuclease VII large subunit [Pseudoflavonifractor sp. An176]